MMRKQFIIKMRWTTRIVGAGIILFFASFILGEGLPDIIKGHMEVIPIMLLLFFALIGYISAYFSEQKGSFLLILSGIAMVIYFLFLGGLHDLKAAGIYGLPFIFMGILFYISSQY